MEVSLSNVNQNLELINEKIKAMKEIETSKWLSNGKLVLLSGTVDIKTETSIEKLAMGYANVVNATKGLQDAYDDLGITTYPVIRIHGNTVDEVKHDIILRNKIIEQKETMDSLTSIKNEWEQLMDKEDKKLALQSRMNNLLSKLP